MQTVHDFLKQAETYYIATIENNQPRVRPFGTINLFQNKLYFLTGKSKLISKQLSVNPRIEICALLGESWLRLEATAVLDESTEAQASMLDAYPMLKEMYTPGDSNTAVYYLTAASAAIFTFSGEPTVIKF